MQQAIAILDSGVGGLTVAKEIMRQLPLESVVYFGDSARSPYGSKHPETVERFTVEIVQFLMQSQPKMVVIACNTATAFALDKIRSMVNIPVIGVIRPGARAAVKNTRSGYIGVIGTEGTIRSGAYERALHEIAPSTLIRSVACPKLVTLVEQGNFDSWSTRKCVEESLAPLGIGGTLMDCLILGCTHYPFLTDAIADVVGPNVNLINSAQETAREVSTILAHRKQLATVHSKPSFRFFCSGDADRFRRIAQSWLDRSISVTAVSWHKEFNL